MFARVNHLATIGRRRPLPARCYRSPFGFRNAGRNGRAASTAVGNRDVGLGGPERRDGSVGGIDRFGMAGADADGAPGRARIDNPGGNIACPTFCRPFAACSGRGPDRNRPGIARG